MDLATITTGAVAGASRGASELSKNKRSVTVKMTSDQNVNVLKYENIHGTILNPSTKINGGRTVELKMESKLMEAKYWMGIETLVMLNTSEMKETGPHVLLLIIVPGLMQVGQPNKLVVATRQDLSQVDPDDKSLVTMMRKNNWEKTGIWTRHEIHHSKDFNGDVRDQQIHWGNFK